MARWARRVAVVPIVAALVVAASLHGVVRVRRARAAAEAKPNVVLIVVDTLRADHLGVARSIGPSGWRRS